MREFNLIITGVGGQGSLTLALVIAEAALAEGYDVKTSELHGLSQRGGVIPCHVRFGKKIYSPIVRAGKADLIIALEPLEALRVHIYGSKGKTVFLIDSERIIPISSSVLGENYPSNEEIKNILREFSSKVFFIDASKTLKKEFGSVIGTNIFMLGVASCSNLLPLKKESLFEGMKRVLPEKYFGMNKEIFEMGCKIKI
ncbi:MAG: indolepyruvate oxidoreductase subunit beta [Candidatus Aenigmarchaeota archaeon]|nr:indolepyruvate oxidoreductase subunit beta [Candidatus Aenigmarchaeota archaeon]